MDERHFLFYFFPSLLPKNSNSDSHKPKDQKLWPHLVKYFLEIDPLTVLSYFRQFDLLSMLSLSGLENPHE